MTEDYLNLLSVYEMEDGKSETQRDVGHITVRSVPLLQYSVQFNRYDGKAIIHSGASTQYISEKVVDTIEGNRLIDVAPRMVCVAGQDVSSKVPVSKIAIFERLQPGASCRDTDETHYRHRLTAFDQYPAAQIFPGGSGEDQRFHRRRSETRRHLRVRVALELPHCHRRKRGWFAPHLH
jgi:hypothetical protein